jgi:hypothetical protein
MKPRHVAAGLAAVVAVIAAIVFATLYFTKDSDSEPDAAADSEAAECGDRSFGHLSSLTSKGDHYELRFDPAWLTSGVTANTAAAEDGAVEPGEPVPNDYYVIDEGHRLLTYRVPTGTPVTVLTNNDTGILSTPITVSELAQLLDGETPIKLFEPLDTGFWIRVQGDTVCAADQQYFP